MKTLMTIVGLVGLLVLGLMTPLSLIYSLYLWGSVGLLLGNSLWLGALLWMKSLGIGLVLAGLGAFFGFKSRTKK